MTRPFRTTQGPEGQEGVVVIGAGGHAKVLISTLAACGVPITAVFDDDDSKWGMDAQGTPVSRTERRRGGAGSSGSATTPSAGRSR